MQIHCPLPSKTSFYLKMQYLYDLDPEMNGNYTPVHVLGVSSYKGFALSLDVEVLSSGAIFSDIPFDAVIYRTGYQMRHRDYKTLVYGKANPGTNIMVSKWGLDKCWIYVPSEGMVKLEGRYLCTVDWPDDNHLVHLVIADDQLWAVPNHKLSLRGDIDELPKYKKLHHEWPL